jgi:hypothetical protein
MTLGPFLVEDGGKLTFRTEDTRPGFTFLWRGRCFAVKLLGGRIALCVPIGRVPSSAGGMGKREAALAVLRGLPGGLPSGWKLRLLADHRLQLDVEEEMAWPATVAALIAPVASMLLRAAPVLDLLDESGLGLMPRPAA